MDKALEWIKSMTWKGIRPIVHFIEKPYENGVCLTKKEMKKYNEKIERSVALPKWDVVIEGTSG